MKIIFFGTPDYVLPVLDALYKEYRTVKEKGIVAVVTQPPKPSGREKKLEYSAVDTWAYKKGVEIHHDYENLPEAELGVVASFGKIIPESVIKHFKYGILNIHPSLLPKYRGASPIQTAIAEGETITGLTIIRMDEKMDHGPIVSSFKEEILPTDTNETLRTKLFERSADFLIGLISSYIGGKIKPKTQNHIEATFTKLIKKEDGFVENIFEDPAKTERLLRAYRPWPGVWTKVNVNGTEKRLKILSAYLDGGRLVLEKVQLEGKKPVSGEEFEKAYPGAL